MKTQANPWQPIKSAPKDKRVLVYSSDVGILEATYVSSLKCWINGWDGGLSTRAVTHWMEAPQLPDGVKKKGKQ